MQCLSGDLREEVCVSIGAQRLTYLGKEYLISTSKFGIGTEEGSNKTPLGLFQVSEMFGSGDPIYSTYKARKKVGVWSFQDNDLSQDGILSRIIRLSGLDASNHNTYQRYIYLHGTNDEDGIGEPRSIGCIRMRNEDIISLYQAVSLGTRVRITD